MGFDWNVGAQFLAGLTGETSKLMHEQRKQKHDDERESNQLMLQILSHAAADEDLTPDQRARIIAQMGDYYPDKKVGAKVSQFLGQVYQQPAASTPGAAPNTQAAPSARNLDPSMQAFLLGQTLGHTGAVAPSHPEVDAQDAGVVPVDERRTAQFGAPSPKRDPSVLTPPWAAGGQGVAVGQEGAQFDDLRLPQTYKEKRDWPHKVSALMSELDNRIQLMGKTYQPGKDARADALVKFLGVAPSQGGGGGPKFNAMAVTRDKAGNLVYPQMNYETGRIEYTRLVPAEGEKPAIDEDAERRRALDLENTNVQRARIGLPALKFNTYPLGPVKQQAEPSNPAAAGVTAGLNSGGVTDVPVLVPTGEPAPVIPRGLNPRRWRESYRRVSSGGGYQRSGAGDGDAKGAGITLHNINSLVSQIKTAERNGYEDAEDVQAMRAQLEQERETARRLHGGQIELNADGSARWKGAGQPKSKIKLPW